MIYTKTFLKCRSATTIAVAVILKLVLTLREWCPKHKSMFNFVTKYNELGRRGR